MGVGGDEYQDLFSQASGSTWGDNLHVHGFGLIFGTLLAGLVGLALLFVAWFTA